MRSVSLRWILASLVALVPFTCLRAEELHVVEVPSATSLTPERLKPGTIAFSDHHDDKLADPATGLIRFEDWSRSDPIQKEFLSLYPGYKEPTIQVTVNGIRKPYTEKLHMYVVEARFLVPKPPGSIDLSRYARLDVLEKIDPAIRHHIIPPEQARPNTDPDLAYNRDPDRHWCEAPQSLCIESRYPLEGKLPMGIRLVNRLQEGHKKISESMDFQSELRVLPPEAIDQAGLAKLTALDAPVTGVLEQSLFSVNQIMQFGKLVMVLQDDAADPGQTVATVFMALAIETDVLERKREFENVPVLRNLIPSQVLMGRSSFNSGNSISAGLPDYTRNRIRAIAGLLDQ